MDSSCASFVLFLVDENESQPPYIEVVCCANVMIWSMEDLKDLCDRFLNACGLAEIILLYQL